MGQERIEFRKRPGIQGSIQEILVNEFPGLYLLLRGVRREIPFSSYTAQKTIGDVTFTMKVGSRQEQVVVDGACFEENLLKRMLGVIEPGMIIYDIGAATSTHTLPAAIKTGAKGRVYSFEPDAECGQALEYNIDLNSLTNIVVLPIALWEKDRSLALHTSGKKGQAPQVTEKGQAPPNNFKNHLEITARSLASLVNDRTIMPPDVVKIDVEGAGLQVLLGMEDLRPRNIFIEVHPRYGESGEKISELLKNRGYRLASEDRRGSQSHLHFEISTP